MTAPSQMTTPVLGKGTSALQASRDIRHIQLFSHSLLAPRWRQSLDRFPPAQVRRPQRAVGDGFGQGAAGVQPALVDLLARYGDDLVAQGAFDGRDLSRQPVAGREDAPGLAETFRFPASNLIWLFAQTASRPGSSR